jgi:photosystem II stability/assembly factor-like uncharacterized protein
MHSHKLKILAGGLAALLAMLACRIVLPATATLPAAADTASPVIVTATPTVPPPTPAATDTITPLPATATPTVLPLTVAASPAIQVLDMLDANNGWALTDTGVVRSMDGGATWYEVTPAGLNGAPASPFFLDAATGWLVVGAGDPTSGMLYHTTDGGITWASTTVPFGGGSLHFIDPMNGWDLVGLSAGMSHEAVAIFRTSDGGESWSKVFTDDPGASGSSDSLPLVGDKNGITALDANHAWVTGAEPMNDLIYVYATQDGGSTWTLQNLAMPAGYSGAMTGPSQPVFFSASEAVLPVQLFANTTGTDFYISHDGGQTWAASTPIAQGGFLAVASATVFFVWDGGATLNVSQDAGASWSTLTPDITIKDDMVSMQFINASTGWVLTSDANNHRMLRKTVDGGAHWTVLIP